jgi:aspartate aminotransferase
VHQECVLSGAESEAVKRGRVAAVQAMSGTGSTYLAAPFLGRAEQFKSKRVYIGTSAWVNYEPLLNLVGSKVVKYRHYDADRGVVAFSDLLEAVDEAPSGSIFVLQGCCHNPSGADPSNEQWKTTAWASKPKGQFPSFGVVYEGPGGLLAEDAFGLRYFAEQRFELLARQSFLKNFRVYGKRCGPLHACLENGDVAVNVFDQPGCMIRWEFSSSAAYGSRLVNIILKAGSLTSHWQTELTIMRERLVGLRRTLYDPLILTFVHLAPLLTTRRHQETGNQF